MAGEDESSAMRQQLMAADEVYLYKVPPLKNAGGHRAETWNLESPLKTCNFLVERRGDVLVLEFQADGRVFAQSQLDVTKGAKVSQFLEQCVDTSRYYAVKIQGGGGREALIGFGFRDRDKATDLRESLQHYERSIQREKEAHDKMGNYHVAKLAEGEKIHVDVGNKAGKSKVVKSKEKKGGGGAVPLLMKKPPPPSSDEPTTTTKTPEKLTIQMDGIDLNTQTGDSHDDDENESGGAVFEGDEDQWNTDFELK
mmetsp:Transcript_16213/g.44603  ORF Transcript_16213/g.44603 Transcript_16213/m.44603 type:complete len:254 (-) Transcript_16213:120-881(-)